MERSYIAFISYRHLPLEMATAKKLHKRIERFVIPKDLRRDGKKKLGLVFRDQDELPISSNLSENIRQALDRSQFLIVICTPATAKSPWVMREISYFLSHHDRDHVLAVLADGLPDEAFPAPLTEIRSEEGDLLERVEPLAANIVADSDIKRARLFKTESLRILASLIGCPYDALYRREQRFQRRRAAAAATVLALLAGAFIGMLLNRNAQIRAQLQRALVNESKTLAALSERAYGEGDYNGALRYALEALPGEGRERPYVAEAEYALSRELALYCQGVMRYERSLEQESAISVTALSNDGSVFAAVDEYGSLRCWDLNNGALRWEQTRATALYLGFMEDDRSLLVLDGKGVALMDAQSGEERWLRGDLFALDMLALSKDESLGLVGAFFGGDGSECYSLLDMESGQTLDTALKTDGAARYCGAAAFSEDDRFAAMLLLRADGSSADLCVWEIGKGGLRTIDEGLSCAPGAAFCRLVFRPDGDLLLACDDHYGPSFLRLYERSDDWAMRFDTTLDTEKVILQSGGAANSFPSIDLIDSAGNHAAFCCKRDLYMLDLRGGEILWHKTLSGFLLAGKMYDNACLGLVLSDGTVGFCTTDGYWSDDAGIYNFRSGYDLAKAAITGDSYPDASVVLVPEEYPQRASLVRFVDNPRMFQVGAFSSEVKHVVLIASPSGDMVLAIGYDPAGRPYEALFMDGREGSSGENFPLSEDGGWEDPGKLSLTEAGLLISPRGVLDVRSQVFTANAEEDGELVTAIGYAPERVFGACLSGTTRQSLRLFSDGVETMAVDCPEGRWRIEAVGGCGWVLLREESGALALCSAGGEWSTPEDPGGDLRALGGERPLLASWDGERLVIRDLESGKETVTDGLPASTVKLLFSKGEKELLVCSETGELCVIRCSDGAILHRSRHGELGLRFRGENARYTLAEAQNEDRLLLFYDDLTREEALCLVYDRESADCAGAHNTAAYLPTRDSMLVCPVMEGVYLSPFRSRAEIIAAAENSLAVEPGD